MSLHRRFTLPALASPASTMPAMSCSVPHLHLHRSGYEPIGSVPYSSNMHAACPLPKAEPSHELFPGNMLTTLVGGPIFANGSLVPERSTNCD